MNGGGRREAVAVEDGEGRSAAPGGGPSGSPPAKGLSLADFLLFSDGGVGLEFVPHVVDVGAAKLGDVVVQISSVGDGRWENRAPLKQFRVGLKCTSNAGRFAVTAAPHRHQRPEKLLGGRAGTLGPAELLDGRRGGLQDVAKDLEGVNAGSGQLHRVQAGPYTHLTLPTVDPVEISGDG